MDDFIQITVFCPPKPRVGAFVYRNARKVYEMKKSLFPFIDGRKPTIIKAPVNQSADIGSNVTFNCTASGDPAPAVNWTKDDNLLPFNQKVMTNPTTGESQLVITGVRNEDIGGKYRCVASNRVGRKESKAAVLSSRVPKESMGMYSLTSFLPSFHASIFPSFLSFKVMLLPV